MIGPVEARSSQPLVVKSLVPILFMVTACGCFHTPDTLSLVSVDGHVMVAGKPLDRGNINFVPEDSRSVAHAYTSSSAIQPDGSFSLRTHGKAGAPLGKYRVVVGATATPMPEPSKLAGWVPDWIVHEKYTKPNTTDLRVEVAECPDEAVCDFDLEPPNDST